MQRLIYIDVLQVNSRGSSDFCVKNIDHAAFGRREIEIAETGKDDSFRKKNKFQRFLECIFADSKVQKFGQINVYRSNILLVIECI